MTEKGRDPVPSWDGDPATFITYRRRAHRYVESTKWGERYLCGPRLENRLTGKAEVAVERCRPGWLSDDLGVERLLAFLEQRCAKQAVPDVGSRLTSFFFKLRRRRGEHMGAWCMRHQNEYEELRKALARVEGGTVKPARSRSSSKGSSSKPALAEEPSIAGEDDTAEEEKDPW